MKKVWEVIKKIFVWLGAVFVAIFTVLFVKEMPKQVRHDEDDSKDWRNGEFPWTSSAAPAWEAS